MGIFFWPHPEDTRHIEEGATLFSLFCYPFTYLFIYLYQLVYSLNSIASLTFLRKW